MVQLQEEVKHWKEKAQREEGSEKDVLELLGALQMKEVEVNKDEGMEGVGGWVGGGGRGEEVGGGAHGR